MNTMPNLAGWFMDEYDGPRFWSHVSFRGGTDYESDPLATATGECWLWNGGSGPEGRYGRFRIFGSEYQAHRIAYRDFGHKLSDDLDLDHLCRITRCVNPAHLEPVTRAENVRRGLLGNKTHCAHGHPMTPDNIYVQRRGASTFKRCHACVKAAKRSARQRRKASAL